MADDDEGVGLPQKGLNMIIKDVVPDLRIANESRELLNQCCVEFVRHVSREAQRISSCDQRKTIYHDHVQKALRNLAFPADYVQAANSVLDECKIAAEKRLKRKKSRLDKCGIPEEELYLMQQELIEKARREEAEKEMLLFHQQQQIYSQQLQSTSAVFAAQSDAALMTQWMVAGGVPPDESADTFATAAGEQAVKVEVKGEPASSFLPSAGNQMAASSSAALGPVKSEPASENTTEPTPQTASSTAVPLMSNEMRAQLAADFVASLGAGDEENYD